MTYEQILFKVDAQIAVITINRPKSLNALNTNVLTELSNALVEISANEDVRVLILTGAGEKAFVAGADISELAQLNSNGAKYFGRIGHEVMASLQALPIPVIAAVNGFALGGGLELALSCDFVYAAETAKLGLPEINLGIIPGFGGTQRLARLIGKNQAKEMIFTGKMITAAEAEKMGIVNKVVSADTLMDETMKTAQAITGKGKVSLSAAKEAINTGMDTDLKTGCKIETNAFALCFGSEDAREGTTAFLEKRKPNFRGGLKG